MTRDLLHTITKRADAFFEHLPGAARGRARDTHQVRVSARRLLEALPLAGAGTARLCREVRDVRRLCGASRELDVTLECLQARATMHAWPGSLVALVRQSLERRLDARRRQARETLEAVDGWHLRKAIRTAGRAAGLVPRQELQATLQRRLRERARNVARAAKAVGALYDAESLHRARIAIKKLRYTREIGEDMGVLRTSRQLGGLKRLQEQLGELHDLDVLKSEIHAVQRALGPRRPAVARGMTRMVDALDVECRILYAALLPELQRQGGRGAT